jgi:hypothetical protein
MSFRGGRGRLDRCRERRARRRRRLVTLSFLARRERRGHGRDRARRARAHHRNRRRCDSPRGSREPRGDHREADDGYDQTHAERLLAHDTLPRGRCVAPRPHLLYGRKRPAIPGAAVGHRPRPGVPAQTPPTGGAGTASQASWCRASRRTRHRCAAQARAGAGAAGGAALI